MSLILHCGVRCGHETNPLAEWLWLRGGVVALALDKVAIALVLAPGVWAHSRWLHTPRVALWTLVVVDAAVAVTAANNAFALLSR